MTISLDFQKHKKQGRFVATHKLHDLDLWNPIFLGKCATGALSFSPASAAADEVVRKRKGHGKEVADPYGLEGSGDSDEYYETPPSPPFPPALDESRSPPGCNSSKRTKRSSTTVGTELNKALEIMRMTEKESHEKKLYRAVKDMEEVRKRGVLFQTKVILSLVDRKVDKLFVEFETDEEKWAMISHLANDSD